MPTVAPIRVDWKSALADANPPITEVAPPAALSYLALMNWLGLGAATTPYAAQSFAVDQSAKAGSYWYWCQAYGPAGYAGQAAFGRASDHDPSATMVNTQTYSSTDVSQISIKPPDMVGNEVFPPEFGVKIARSAKEWSQTPGATMDRMYELPTPYVLNPQVELFWGINFHSFSVYIEQKQNLEIL